MFFTLLSNFRWLRVVNLTAPTATNTLFPLLFNSAPIQPNVNAVATLRLQTSSVL